MVSNFAFLKDSFPPLARLGAKAEEYCYSDPNSCLIKLGMIGETIVDMMFTIEGLKEPKDSTAAKRINILRREGLIESDMATELHSIRQVRNKAAHDNYESTDECLHLLPIVFNICQWFMPVYGDYTYQNREFVPIPKPRTITAVKESAQEAADDEAMAARAIEFSKPTTDISTDERKKKAKAAARKRHLDENETRCIIDEQLRCVGWLADSVNIRYSQGTRPKKGVNQAIAEWPTNNGHADYALFLGLTMVGTIEAKRMDTDVYSVFDGQGANYPRQIREADKMYTPRTWGDYKVPFSFAANGRPYIEQYKEKSGIWFRDLRDPSNAPQALHGWIDPKGLQQKLDEVTTDADEDLANTPYDLLRDEHGLNLRDYQVEAIEAAEQAVRNGQKAVLLAMATGTGKTRTVLGMMYRYLASERFHRILFLVDRTVLGDQAMNTFRQVRVDQLLSLDSMYNIKSLDDDPTVDRETKVQLATVQSLVRRILYHEGGTMPSITDFDLIIVDEAHRGYILDKEMTDEESLYRDDLDFMSKYRYVMEYFDAVKIALTATPAQHTTQIFGKPVFTYSYRDAVIDGYLVDHDVPIRIVTKTASDGIHYAKGDTVDVYDPNTHSGVSTYELPDDMDFDVDAFNKSIMVEGFNKAVLQFIADRIDPDDREGGKTLIYAVNDRHADMIVRILKEYYGAMGVSTDAIMKITGSIENGNPKRIREAVQRFKNEQYPSIVVTVDLLTTGVDVPAITNLVFLRRVKSRILFEQMLGRATRLCPDIHKEKFTIYDAVGVYDAFEAVNTMKPVVVQPRETFHTLIEGLKNGTQTDAALQEKITAIVAKLRRKQKNVHPEDEEAFADATATKNIADFIHAIRTASTPDSVEKLIASEDALTALEQAKGYYRPIFIDHRDDTVTSVEATYGHDEKPDDYIDSFVRWIKSNQNDVAALSLVMTSPKDLTSRELRSLRKLLGQHDFTETKLNTALAGLGKADVAADIISLIRRAAMGSPLLSRKERMDKALARFRADMAASGITLTKAQENFLDRLATYFTKDENYVINATIFDDDSRLKRDGGYKRFNRIFKDHLDDVLKKLSDYLYDDGGTSA